MEEELPEAEVDKPAATYEEASLERSKSFVTALQELKNLRPQLYSAAEYCERSYRHSDQKEMVLDNIKDYAARALVNAVDHLGTVAFKLTDILEQNTADISSMDMKITCLNQQLLACQTYAHNEGLRQQQLLEVIPRHHKHYTLPNPVSKKVHFSSNVQMAHEQQVQAKTRLFPLAQTLSWHLASETSSTLKGSQGASSSLDNSNDSRTTAASFISGAELSGGKKSSSHVANARLATAGPDSSAPVQKLGITQQVALESSKPTSPFRSFDSPKGKEIVRVHNRSKNGLAAFFLKQMTQKAKTALVL